MSRLKLNFGALKLSEINSDLNKTLRYILLLLSLKEQNKRSQVRKLSKLKFQRSFVLTIIYVMNCTKRKVVWFDY